MAVMGLSGVLSMFMCFWQYSLSRALNLHCSPLTVTALHRSAMMGGREREEGNGGEGNERWSKRIL